MIKSKTELEIMNTKNLLRYYKAERGRFYDTKYRFEHNCCTFDEPRSHLENHYNEQKSILDSREHIN